MKTELEHFAGELSEKVDSLDFSQRVHTVYNPLRYAWNGHAQYLQKFGRPRKQVLFLGINPGPWGMAQTGVPFGEIRTVQDWMGIDGEIGKPEKEHQVIQNAVLK